MSSQFSSDYNIRILACPTQTIEHAMIHKSNTPSSQTSMHQVIVIHDVDFLECAAQSS